MSGIRLQMLRTLRVSAVLLAGCGVTLSESDWRGPVGGDWAKDSYECEREARLSVGSGGRETFREVRSLIEKCVVARGYSRRCLRSRRVSCGSRRTGHLVHYGQ